MVQFSKRMGRVAAGSDVVHQVLQMMDDPAIISFGGGNPAEESYPIDEIQSIVDGALKREGGKLLQYGLTEGWAPLRTAYLEKLVQPKGIKASVDNILITTGATEGNFLICEAFLDESDTVLIETPTFFSTLMLFAKYGCRCIPVEADDIGMDMADLEQKLQEYHPKLLYTVPTFQNPTGRTLPLERRKRIASLAALYDTVVVEDDPYCELRYCGSSVPPIKAFDKTGHVVMVNSFSKIISPGMRVGAVVADPAVIHRMSMAKLCSDTHTTTIVQEVCAEYLKHDLLADHLVRIAPMYRERLDTMKRCIDEYFPKNTVRTDPEGGLFIWARIPGIDMEEAMKRSLQEYSVGFVPGYVFYPDLQHGRDEMRLNFSSNTPAIIEEGMKKLGGLLCAMVQEG